MIQKSITAGKDTNLVKLYIDIADSYAQNNKVDSAIFYAKKSVELSKKLGFKRGEASAYSYLGEFTEQKGQRIQAIQHYTEAYQLYTQLKNKHRAAAMLNYIGVAYDYLGEFDKALQYLFESAQMKESIQNWNGLADVYNDIGIVYEQMKEYFKAIDYYSKALKLCEEHKQPPRKIANLYNNIGVIHYDQGKFDEALEYFNKSFKIRQEIKSPRLESSYYNIANIYFHQKQYAKALGLYKSALKLVSEQQRNQQIANYNITIGQTYIYLQKYDSAHFHIDAGNQIAKKYHYKNAELYSYNIQSKLDSVQNNYQGAFSNQKKYIALKDSLLNSEKVAQIAKFQIAYENDKQNAENKAQIAILQKERERQEAESRARIAILQSEREKEDVETNNRIALLQKDQERQEMESQFREKVLKEYQKRKDLENAALKKKQEDSEQEKKAQNRQMLWIISASSVIIMVIFILLLVIYHSNIKKTVAYKLLQDKTNELNQKTEQVTSQAEILKLYNDQMKHQNKELLNAYSKMTDSILYAERLQYAVVGNEHDLKVLYPESFVLYMPRDIVSGDFLWTTQVNNLKIIVVADCTGHGVPGSLMTFLGVSALNEIICTKHITAPKEILEELDKKIIEFLSKSSENLQKSDGMDIIVACIDEQNKVMHYSGAKNPLYKLRNNDLEIFEANAFSLGFNIFEEEKIFESQSLPLENGDIFYLCSDGYQDQFGGEGEKPKKYLNKKLKETFLEIADLPFPEQKSTLAQKLKKWKGKYPQTDDILVVGFQITL